MSTSQLSKTRENVWVVRKHRGKRVSKYWKWTVPLFCYDPSVCISWKTILKVMLHG